MLTFKFFSTKILHPEKTSDPLFDVRWRSFMITIITFYYINSDTFKIENLMILDLPIAFSVLLSEDVPVTPDPLVFGLVLTNIGNVYEYVHL